MLSTRVMQLGVHSVCSKHGEAWDAYEATYQQGTGTTEPASEPAPVDLAFDTEHTFADGVTISVSEPVPYTRTEDDLYAALAEGGPDDGARLTVTVTNGSQGEGTPSSLFGSATPRRTAPGVRFRAPGRAGQSRLHAPARPNPDLRRAVLSDRTGDLVITYTGPGSGLETGPPAVARLPMPKLPSSRPTSSLRRRLRNTCRCATSCASTRPGPRGCPGRQGCNRASTALTRWWSSSDGGGPSFAKIDEMCFSTAPSVTTRARPIALFVRPSAISASTSRSRGDSAESGSRARRCASSVDTTSGPARCRRRPPGSARPRGPPAAPPGP